MRAVGVVLYHLHLQGQLLEGWSGGCVAGALWADGQMYCVGRKVEGGQAVSPLIRSSPLPLPLIGCHHIDCPLPPLGCSDL